jgi:hypothetical protein
MLPTPGLAPISAIAAVVTAATSDSCQLKETERAWKCTELARRAPSQQSILIAERQT